MFDQKNKEIAFLREMVIFAFFVVISKNDFFKQ